VYVYELPARMNVLALKVEHDWRRQLKGKKFDYRMPLVFFEARPDDLASAPPPSPPPLHLLHLLSARRRQALLRSPHRTALPAEADFFFVPVWDFHGAWGNNEVYYRGARYISTAHPMWNASGGADHLWAVARDAAACATPWGSLREELAASTLLSNWGGVTGLSGREEERCFRPAQDVVVPGPVTHATVERSPLLLPPSERDAQMAARSTQLFFFGALCWKTDNRARSLEALEKKCATSYRQPGFLSRYSFGLRYDVWKRHRDAKGFRLYASDFPPSLPKGGVRLDEEILAARYCLCPSGTGWGMRVFHVIALGCVPVLVQHDGEHPRVMQAFEPALNWSAFAISVRKDQVGELPALLAAADLGARQRALATVWSRLVWRDALREPLRSRLAGPDAFEMTMAALGRLAESRRRSGTRRPATIPRETLSDVTDYIV
jgi:hypothetical protein